ncbi:hypothetical protein C2E23DRAFT_605107 [Lenzites betulinus]|nr:hypothetical protein C2E23DRAFT_605107 [Lenzites betulinus]
MDVTDRALSELANSQIQLVRILAWGFDALVKQTLDVITIGPATEAMREVESLRVEIRARHDGRKIDKDGAEAAARAKAEEVVRSYVRPQLEKMVAEAIANLIAARVRAKLQELVSPEIKTELATFRHRVNTMRIKLENDEARFCNSLIPSSQPLRKLRRPLVPLGVLLGTPNVDGAGANGDGKGKTKKKANGNADANAAVAGAGEPSQVFPRTTDDIPTLDAATARRLVEEYQIVPPAEAEADGWEDVAEDAAGDGAGGGGEGDKDDSGRSTPNTTRRNMTQSTGAKTGMPRTPAATSDPKKSKAAKEKEKEKEEREKREAALKERRRVADLNAFMHFKRVSMGSAVLLMWLAVCSSLGDGWDAGARLEFS